MANSDAEGANLESTLNAVEWVNRTTAAAYEASKIGFESLKTVADDLSKAFQQAADSQAAKDVVAVGEEMATVAEQGIKVATYVGYGLAGVSGITAAIHYNNEGYGVLSSIGLGAAQAGVGFVGGVAGAALTPELGGAGSIPGDIAAQMAFQNLIDHGLPDSNYPPGFHPSTDTPLTGIGSANAGIGSMSNVGPGAMPTITQLRDMSYGGGYQTPHYPNSDPAADPGFNTSPHLPDLGGSTGSPAGTNFFNPDNAGNGGGNGGGGGGGSSDPGYQGPGSANADSYPTDGGGGGTGNNDDGGGDGQTLHDRQMNDRDGGGDGTNTTTDSSDRQTLHDRQMNDRDGGDGDGSTGNTSTGVNNTKEDDRPILLDLAGTGINITELNRSNTFMDANGSGLSHKTAWAGMGSGVLFFDPNGTGAITQKNQYELR